jgi:hypothetical protein
MPTAPGNALRISPAWLAALAAGAIGATLGYPVARIIFARQLDGRLPEWFVALTTGLLCILVVLRAATRDTRGGAGMCAFSWSIVAGGFNAGLAAQYQAWSPSRAFILAPFLFATLLGFIFALPLSGLFGLVNTALAMGAHQTRRARSHQALDLMMGYAGASVAAFAALRLAAAPDVWALLPIAVGSLVATVGFGRARARRAWLRAVDLGNVPGLSIEILEGDRDPGLPCLIGKADTATAVLVREREDGQHYRTAPPQREQHIALIDPWGS